LATTMLPER